MKRIIVIGLVLISVVGLGTFFYAGNQNQETRIVILHTNDMHAHLKNFSKFADVVEKTRAGNKNVFLVCAGDIFSGNPVVDQYPEKGYPQIDLMNQVGFQLAEIGNHEFDYGQEILAKRIAEAKFPFICANMQVEQSPLKQPNPDYVWHVHGLKIAFLGLLETSINNLPATAPDKVKGINFPNAIIIAGQYTDLKKENDAVIGLTHLGVETDVKLANQFSYFDVIIGGHSHTVIKNPKVTNSVLITQAGDYLNYVGKLTLIFKGHQLMSKNDELINLNDYSDKDPQIEAMVEKYENNESLNQVIGEAVAPIRGKDELGSMYTDALRASGSFDFAFQNNGGIRIPVIDKGPITVKTIYELDPFGNDLVSLEMNYEELKSLLHYAYTLHDKPEMQISGGQYVVLLDSSGHYKDVTIKDNSGHILDPDENYLVGLNSYVMSSYKFKHLDPGKSMMITTAETVINFVRSKQKLNYAGIKRVFVEKNGSKS